MAPWPAPITECMPGTTETCTARTRAATGANTTTAVGIRWTQVPSGPRPSRISRTVSSRRNLVKPQTRVPGNRFRTGKRSRIRRIDRKLLRPCRREILTRCNRSTIQQHRGNAGKRKRSDIERSALLGAGCAADNLWAKRAVRYFGADSSVSSSWKS
jgi:hypothetical protein